MKKESLALYEGMYVLSATLSDEARKQLLNKMINSISEKGGSLEKLHEQGYKKLAYSIAKKREGYYYVMYFKALPSTIKDLWKEYRIQQEEILRFITLRVDEVQETLTFKPLRQAQ